MSLSVLCKFTQLWSSHNQTETHLAPNPVPSDCTMLEHTLLSQNKDLTCWSVLGGSPESHCIHSQSILITQLVRQKLSKLAPEFLMPHQKRRKAFKSYTIFLIWNHTTPYHTIFVSLEILVNILKNIIVCIWFLSNRARNFKKKASKRKIGTHRKTQQHSFQNCSFVGGRVLFRCASPAL